MSTNIYNIEYQLSMILVSFLFLFFLEYQLFFNKVSLKTSIEINPSNFLYVFILSVNFKNLVSRLHVLIISFMLSKF